MVIDYFIRMFAGEVTFQKGKKVIVDEKFASQVERFMEEDFLWQQLGSLKQELAREDPIGKHHAIIGLRKIISTQTLPIDDFMKAGMLAVIVEYAKMKDFPQIQLEAVWILTNLATGASQHLEVLMENGALQIFIEMLHNSNDEFIDQGFWGLGNICGDSHKYRDLAIEHGIKSMNSNLRSAIDRNQRPSYFDNACWALSNICRTKPYPPFYAIRETIEMFVQILARYGDLNNDVVKDISCSLVHNLNEEVSELIVNSNAINLLMSFVKYQQKDINLLFSLLILLRGLLKHQPAVVEAQIKADIIQQCFMIIDNADSSLTITSLKLLRSISEFKVGISKIIRFSQLPEIFESIYSNQDTNIDRQVLLISLNLVQKGGMQSLIFLETEFAVNLINFCFEEGAADHQLIACQILYEIVLCTKKFAHVQRRSVQKACEHLSAKWSDFMVILERLALSEDEQFLEIQYRIYDAFELNS